MRGLSLWRLCPSSRLTFANIKQFCKGPCLNMKEKRCEQSMRAAFAHTAHTTPAAAASPATARTSATAPSTRPPCGPAPPEPACATPTRLWNTTITRSVANTQHLHTMPCCNTATRPHTEDGAGNSLTLRGKAPAPLARPRHATQRSRQAAMPCLLHMLPCPGSGTASDSPCPDRALTNQRT